MKKSINDLGEISGLAFDANGYFHAFLVVPDALAENAMPAAAFARMKSPHKLGFVSNGIRQ